MNPLKKITLTPKNKNGLLLFFIFFCLGGKSLQAQVQNNGTLFVGDNTTLFIQSGNLAYGTGSVTSTSRSGATSGKIQLGATATTSGATSGSNLFVNGYASTLKSTYFVLPTGQSLTYAPIGVTNTTVTNGVSAAYVHGTPANSTLLSAALTALYSVGSWNAFGDNAKISLLWNSDISALSATIADLTVAGYNTLGGKWEAIPSANITGTLTSGTIQTASDVVLATYSAFTLAKKGITCPLVFTSSGTTKTFDGTIWTPSNPTENDNAIIANANTGILGAFVCNSLTVNANITLTDGKTIEVVNEISGSATITMSSLANIVQRNDASTITTPVVITKSTRAGMFAYDYIYAGSPLTGNSFSQLSNAQAFNIANTASTGVADAFDLKFKYVSGDASATGGWQALTETSPGKGFIMRIKQQAPYATFGTASTDHINLKFSGNANNGTITTAVANIVATPTSPRNNNLLANPYPSAIDADKFLEYNTNLDGALYVWKSQTASTGLPGSTYTAGDYIAYTRAGVTRYGTVGTTPFDGKISSGQGFLVKSNFGTGTGDATFNNCMRVVTASTLLRTSSTIDRYKLNLNGANNVGNQILVAYMPEGTLAYDRMYDAELNTVSPAQMYSILDNTSTQLGINARPTFATTDVVKLGIDKSNVTPENFSIAIVEKEGAFEGTAINVLLHDKLLNTYQNLSNGAYNFTSNSTQLQNRFEIVYQEAALGTSDFDTTNVFATISSQALKITASLPISNVTVYDLTGRLVTKLTIDNLQQVNHPFLFAKGVYIVKIKLNNGATATQKLLNH